jgi:plasmid maintenance system killer protein
MDFRFSDSKLEKLYTKGTGARGYPEGVVDSFLRRVRTIDAAKDERDLRVPASVHFEKLRGKYAGSFSMRLMGRWRLILRIVPMEERRVVVIDEITPHYGD